MQSKDFIAAAELMVHAVRTAQENDRKHVAVTRKAGDSSRSRPVHPRPIASMSGFQPLPASALFFSW